MSDPDHMPSESVAMRRRMVASQLRPSGVTDVAVLAAMDVVRRERFVGDDQFGVAYRDTIVPLAEGRGVNPPLSTARLLQAAQPQRGQRALLIGAATGYVAAVLAQMGVTVTALEEVPALAARARLALSGDAAVTVVAGPLTAGWPEGAPYDIVYLDGAVASIPEALTDQLVDGGVLVGGIVAAAGVRTGGVVERGITHLVAGRRVAGGFNTTSFADMELASLPGFAPAPAFAF